MASIALNEPLPVKLGDYVTFTTDDIPKTVKNPRIEVDAYQDGKLVFGMGGAIDYAFQLGGAGSEWLWAGGPAHCVATLFYFGKEKGQQTFNPLAKCEFDALARE